MARFPLSAQTASLVITTDIGRRAGDRGGTKGSAGEVTLIEKNSFPIDTTYYVKQTDPQESNIIFLYWLLKSLNLPDLRGGAGIPGLNRTDVYQAHRLPLPPLEVQRGDRGGDAGYQNEIPLFRSPSRMKRRRSRPPWRRLVGKTSQPWGNSDQTEPHRQVKEAINGGVRRVEPQGSNPERRNGQAEYGVSRDFIVKGIEAAKLEFRPGSIWGNAYLRILRSQLEGTSETWRGVFGESQESDRAAPDQEGDS